MTSRRQEAIAGEAITEVIMSRRDQAFVVLHGAVVLLVGSFFGFPVAAALESGSGSLHAWTSAHAAVTAGGVMLIAMGAALHLVTLGPRGGAWLRWSLVAAGYGAVVGLGLGAITGLRGFDPVGPPLNLVAFAGNLAVVWGSTVGVGLFLWGAGATAHRAPSERSGKTG
jgi:hypothetical protein